MRRRAAAAACVLVAAMAAHLASTRLLPLASWLISVAVLVVAGLGGLDPLAVAFAAAAQLAAISRTALTVHETRQLAETRRQGDHRRARRSWRRG